ncbi:MAG: 30S ribosomal protein S6 [Dehalococcoidia bacterium]|nr:30S ribosomal protein S6 [Dehalococcoidia bacterium]
MLRDYEMVTIISPKVAEEELAASIEKLTQLVVGRGGTMSNVTPWGRRKLAYTIKSFNEGNYILAQFKLDPKMVSGLEADMMISEDLIRHLVVRVGD